MHGYIRDDIVVITVIPIRKGKNSDVTDSTNYRNIALRSIFCKICDLIVLDLYSNELVTSHLQFGFKNKRSAKICVA